AVLLFTHAFVLHWATLRLEAHPTDQRHVPAAGWGAHGTLRGALPVKLRKWRRQTPWVRLMTTATVRGGSDGQCRRPVGRGVGTGRGATRVRRCRRQPEPRCGRHSA